MKKNVWAVLTLALSLVGPLAHGAALHVVAAENVYGSIAKQLGGPEVVVESILNNPNQDPHLFSSKPSTSKSVADADILILNGADYDTWFERLLSVKSTEKAVSVINIAKLVNVKSGANPHLWYRLSYVNQFATALAADYERRLPRQKAVFEARLQTFLSDQQQLTAEVTELKERVHGLSVTATEPVAAYLAQDLGLVMLDEAFQLAVMNDAEPSAQSRAEFERHLRTKQVRALIYNQQVQDPVTEFMQKLSKDQGIPVIGVTELLPADQTYTQWYRHTLDKFRLGLMRRDPLN